MSVVKTILIVEDDLQVQELLRECLEIEGFNVLTAQNGQVALDILGATVKPNLIFLDLRMPVLDGFEFLQRFRGDPELASIPVIITSASANRNEISGATAFIRKPFDLNKLMKAAHQYCHRVEPRTERTRPSIV